MEGRSEKPRHNPGHTAAALQDGHSGTITEDSEGEELGVEEVCRSSGIPALLRSHTRKPWSQARREGPSRRQGLERTSLQPVSSEVTWGSGHAAGIWKGQGKPVFTHKWDSPLFLCAIKEKEEPLWKSNVSKRKNKRAYCQITSHRFSGSRQDAVVSGRGSSAQAS